MPFDPFAHDRLGGLPHVEFRIEHARHALDHHHGLLQQDQFGARAHVEQPGHLEEEREQLRHGNLFGGPVVDRLADRADRLREIVDRVLRRHVAGLEMHLRGAAIVARDEAVEDLGEEAPLLRADAPHDAEIDRDDAAVVVHEQIAGMHVGMEEAVAQRVAQEGLHHRAAELLEVEALRHQRLAIGKARALHPFERQHVAGRAVPVDAGNAEIRVVARVLGHLGERGGFEPQVHLQRDGARERVHDVEHPQALRFRRMALGKARREVEGLDVGAEAVPHIRPQHLHGHGPAPFRRVPLGAMHLRDRGRRDRRPEGRIGFRERALQRLRDGGFRRGLRERRQLVLQRLEIARQRDADDIGPRREKLAELHVARPQPRERGRETPLRLDIVAPLHQPQHREAATRAAWQRRGVDQPQHALAREHEARPRETGEMDETEDHRRQPECSATMPPLSACQLTRANPASRIIPAKRSGRGKLRIDSTR